MNLYRHLARWPHLLQQRFVPSAAQGSAAVEPPATLRLERGCSQTLGSAAGRRVACVTGCLWLTHDGEQRDIIVEAGQTYHVDSARRMIVYALEPSHAAID